MNLIGNHGFKTTKTKESNRLTLYKTQCAFVIIICKNFTSNQVILKDSMCCTSVSNKAVVSFSFCCFCLLLSLFVLICALLLLRKILHMDETMLTENERSFNFFFLQRSNNRWCWKTFYLILIFYMRLGALVWNTTHTHILWFTIAFNHHIGSNWLSEMNSISRLSY